jgi:hypothetical protein
MPARANDANEQRAGRQVNMAKAYKARAGCAVRRGRAEVTETNGYVNLHEIGQRVGAGARRVADRSRRGRSRPRLRPHSLRPTAAPAPLWPGQLPEPVGDPGVQHSRTGAFQSPHFAPPTGAPVPGPRS